MNAVAAAALRWLGTPWLHGASVRGQGCDCLGLIRGVLFELSQQELIIPPYVKGWHVTEPGEPLLAGLEWHLERADEIWRPGDILAFRMRPTSSVRHVGILVENEPTPRFVHCLHGRGVVAVALSQPWQSRVVARFQIPSTQRL